MGDVYCLFLCYLFLDPSGQPTKSLGLAGDPTTARIDAINTRLYEARAKRDQPGRDDKIIAGWNGLMIAGLAVAGSLNPAFVAAARRGADFVLGNMVKADGTLDRTFVRGTAGTPGVLEDYALLAHGLIQLHLADPHGPGPSKYFTAARQLMAKAESLFGDGSGGFFDTRADQADLFVRARSVHDGAMPSGASVMVNNYVDLARITGEASYRTKAAGVLALMSGAIAAHPLGAANALRGLLRLLMLDRAAVAAALQGAKDPARGTGMPGDEGEVVEIMSAVDTVEIPAEGPIGIVLRIKIAEGFHLTAAMPGDGVFGLVPFSVHIVGGSGVRVYADYPAGEAYGDPPHGVIGAYSGEFDLPIVLERDGDWKGTPLIGITYQPCTDNACLAARTVELDVAVERG